MHTPRFPNFGQIDTYILRNEIYAFLTSSKAQLDGKLLDIGCGRMPYKDWIMSETTVTRYTGLDIDNPIYNDSDFRPDMVWDGIKIPSDDNQYDTAILMEVLEHCEFPEIALGEAYRVLKPGGKLLFSVPFLWYYHDVPHDFNRYTFYKLKGLVTKAGFKIDEIIGYGSWGAFMAQAWAMWIKRNSLPKLIRFGFYLLGLPFYFLLYRKGKKIRKFETHDMPIGHYGVLTKPK